MEAFEVMVDSRIVFLNEQWENSRDKTVLALGRLFDSDRKKAIRFMETEGVKMTRMIETATQDYYDTHFYTLGKKERRQVKEYQTQLADQKRQLADKGPIHQNTRRAAGKGKKTIVALHEGDWKGVESS